MPVVGLPLKLSKSHTLSLQLFIYGGIYQTCGAARPLSLQNTEIDGPAWNFNNDTDAHPRGPFFSQTTRNTGRGR